jgi:hypothetical protein
LLHHDFKQLPGFIAQLQAESGTEGVAEQPPEQLSLL